MFSINTISVIFNTFFAYLLNTYLIAAREEFQNFEKWLGLSRSLATPDIHYAQTISVG